MASVAIVAHSNEARERWAIRQAEVRHVLGLVVGDIDLKAGVIRLRENHHRGLQTKAATRDVPIWPGLRPTLAEVVAGQRVDALLFTTEGGTLRTNVPLTAWARALKRAGLKISSHGARHSYISQGLQCMDAGKPVSPFTVIKEVGHADLKLIEQRYGHVATRRVRIEGFGYDDSAE
jgi:integrase